MKMKVQIIEDLELDSGFTYRAYDSCVCITVLFVDTDGKTHSRELRLESGLTESEITTIVKSQHWSDKGVYLPEKKSTRTSQVTTEQTVDEPNYMIGFRSENKKSLWQRFLTFVKRLWKK